MSPTSPSPDSPTQADDSWEPWRIWFAQHFFTTLQGMSAGIWARHLWRNRFRIEPRFAARASLITISSPVNALFASADRRKFGKEIAETPLQPPIFILGHWRSGTTLLQRLFAIDERFSYPTFYQCLFPRGFLHSQERNSKKWAGMLPRTRIFDNMANDFTSPAEDEFALCSLTGFSPYMAWTFPRAWEEYHRYLTFDNVPEWELREWKREFRTFVQKIQYHTGKRVVLKSPTHTCRINLLKQMFPGAKFVHIHRDPYAVFPSSKKMLTTFLRNTQLQSVSEEFLEDQILSTYRRMYNRFFAEHGGLGSDEYAEIAYEELEADPVEVMRQTYEKLELPEFGVVEPALREYASGLRSYQKNKFSALPDRITARIKAEWKNTFDEWGYALDRNNDENRANPHAVAQASV